MPKDISTQKLYTLISEIWYIIVLEKKYNSWSKVSISLKIAGPRRFHEKKNLFITKQYANLKKNLKKTYN